jgi:predicted secreted protein
MRVHTGGSGMYLKYDKHGRVDRWAGPAELVLEGLDMASNQQVAPNIAPFVLAPSAFSLSTAVKNQTESELMLEAIAAFKAKAQAATKAFDCESFEAAQVSVPSSDTGALQARSMTRMTMQADSMQSSDQVTLDAQPGWPCANVTVGGTVSMR